MEEEERGRKGRGEGRRMVVVVGEEEGERGGGGDGGVRYWGEGGEWWEWGWE